MKPWNSLSRDEKKLYAAFMENYAGYLAFADHERGRLPEAVKGMPDADNTLIFSLLATTGRVQRAASQVR
ncbi:MAG TPA: hypothetical protein VNU92_13025 [Edaphobacter sp.]|nr:hypothetical protein [Edaphobacter sp.]